MHAAKIITALGNFPVDAEGELALERAIQTGERYSFKIEDGRGKPTYFSGKVRRAAGSARDYLLDTGETASA